MAKNAPVELSTKFFIRLGIYNNPNQPLSYDFAIKPGEQFPPIPSVGDVVEWTLPDGAQRRTKVESRNFEMMFDGTSCVTRLNIWASPLP